MSCKRVPPAAHQSLVEANQAIENLFSLFLLLRTAKLVHAASNNARADAQSKL